MSPMHGTVGVAPASLEVRSALVPDAFGGNMGTPEMRAGVTCYLGVNVPGGLLARGDGHARQPGPQLPRSMKTLVITPTRANSRHIDQITATGSYRSRADK
jgi:hypothetical protein